MSGRGDWRAPTRSGLVIAAFRHVGAAAGSWRGATPTRFDRQLAWLAGRLPARPLDDALEVAHSTLAVVLTRPSLDWIDHALPAVERHGVPVTAFVDVDALEHPDHRPDVERPLDWPGVVELSRSTLVTIGLELRRADIAMGPDRLAEHLDTATRLLGARAGLTVTQVWYPDGPAPPPATDRVVRGRARLATVSGGGANRWTTDPFRLRRTEVAHHAGPGALDALAAGRRGLADLRMHVAGHLVARRPPGHP